MRPPSPTIKTQPRKDNRKMPARFLRPTQLQQMPENARGAEELQIQNRFFAATKNLAVQLQEFH